MAAVSSFSSADLAGLEWRGNAPRVSPTLDVRAARELPAKPGRRIQHACLLEFAYWVRLRLVMVVADRFQAFL